MFMKKLFVISFMLLCFIGANAKKKPNPYQTKGTKEYEAVTAKLIGQWNISSFTSKGNEKIGGDLYDKATVEFKEFNESGDGGVAIFCFTINKSIVDKRIASRNKNETTIVVDSYQIISRTDYRINDSGDIIYFENQANSVDIKGSGEKFGTFNDLEGVFVQSQSSMKNTGGLANLAGAKLLKTVSETDFVPNIPGQVNYKNLTDNSVDFVTIFKVNLKLVK
jgi:hypothetical protein